VSKIPTSRRRLIALNSGENLARDSICKLAQCLEEWVSSTESTPVLGQRLGIPAADMAEARRLTDAAHKLANQQLLQAEGSSTEIVTLLDPPFVSSSYRHPCSTARVEFPLPRQ
jgi:hypothetical protein